MGAIRAVFIPSSSQTKRILFSNSSHTGFQCARGTRIVTHLLELRSGIAFVDICAGISVPQKSWFASALALRAIPDLGCIGTHTLTRVEQTVRTNGPCLTRVTTRARGTVQTKMPGSAIVAEVASPPFITGAGPISIDVVVARPVGSTVADTAAIRTIITRGAAVACHVNGAEVHAEILGSYP